MPFGAVRPRLNFPSYRLSGRLLLLGLALLLMAPHAGLAKSRSNEPLTPEARQYIKTVKARLRSQLTPRPGRDWQRLRAQAQKIAVEEARRRRNLRADRQRESQRQLKSAREQQLKFLYAQALERYRTGHYQQAIDLLQQMVMIEPGHELVKAAERLMAQADSKLLEQRAMARASTAPVGTSAAGVSDLERLLTEKRIEQETQLKFAKAALQSKDYDKALELVYRVLHDDPQQAEALRLREQLDMAKLKHEAQQLEGRVAIDEQQMRNEISKRELLQPEPTTMKAAATLTSAGQAPVMEQMMAHLTQPISFDFQDVAFSDVLQFLADSANISVIPSPQLDLKQRHVSMKVNQLPLGIAIKYLVKNQALAYRVEPDAILIATPEEFSNEPLQTRVFFLRSGFGPFALEAAAIEPNAAIPMDSIQELIKRSVPQPTGSKIVRDERSGALVITNTADNLKLVERLLGQLDVTPLQVLIEARFVELTLSELEQFSVEGVLTGNVALTKQTTGATSATHTRGPGNQLASGSGEKFPAIARENEGANVTLQGVLTGTQFESVLHLLEERGKTKTLSAPRVTTLNNQPATIRVVEEFNYPTRYEVSLIQFDINGDGDFDDAGETEFANVPQDLQKRDIGILLNVTPSVGKDLKTITLVLAPEVSQFSQFRNLGGGVTVPEFTSSQLTTSVVIENGQTVVLGGLMKDTTSNTVSKIPVLGDLPVVGPLFRQTSSSSTRKNLLIFITARLLAPRSETT